MKSHVTDYVLYAWRYRIGYTLITLGVIATTIVAAIFVPGALRVGEQDSSLLSAALSFQSIDPSMVVNLPYHLLQRVSFLMFGVTTISIKLSSIILALLTLLGILFLTTTWLRRNVAIIVTLIAFTTGQFLFMSQDGTPGIMFTFLTIWLLAVGTYVTRSTLFSTFWKVIGCVLMATALYTPLGIYLVIALLTTTFFHPHIRHVIRTIGRARIILAIVLGLVSVVPLVYAIIIEPRTLLTLLGVPTGPIDLWQNLMLVARNAFTFSSVDASYLIRPIYSIGVVLLALIGLYRCYTIRHTAHSYVLLILSVLLIPLVVLVPSHLTFTFPVVVAMMALGLDHLIRSWYRLFPRNPYARIAGLVPLSVFIIGMMFSGVTRYVDNYTYNPALLSNYSTDLKLLDHTLDSVHATGATTSLVVTADQKPFYDLVAHYDKRFHVGTDFTTKVPTVIVAHDVYHRQAPTDMRLYRIVTNRKAQNADRFYIYKQAVK